MPRKFKTMLMRLIREEIEHSSGLDLSNLCLIDSSPDPGSRKYITIFNGPQIMEDLEDEELDEINSITNDHVRFAAVKKFLLEEMSYGAYIGRIALLSPEMHDGGKCMNAWEIISSAIHPRSQKKGLGKALYFIAMASIYPDPIMSDRNSVSDKAQRMYKAMDKSSDIEKLPSDNGPYIGKFDNRLRRVTKPKEDDCQYFEGEEDTPDYMNKAYRSGDNDYKQIYEKMKQNGDRFISDMSEKTRIRPEKLVGEISARGDDIFRIAYY